MSTALARREIALERKEMAMRAAARVASIKREASEKLSRAADRIENTVGGANLAIATSGGARIGGIALEAYLKKKLKPETAKVIGPGATVGAIALYTLGLSAKNAKDRYTYLTLAGVADGMASRFLIEQVDRALAT